MARQERKDERFHTVRSYSEGRDVACKQVEIPYRRRGRSWDIEDGQSQFANCSAEVAAKPSAGANRLAIKPSDAAAIAKGRGYLNPQVGRDDQARNAEISLSLSTRQRRLADDARDLAVRRGESGGFSAGRP